MAQEEFNNVGQPPDPSNIPLNRRPENGRLRAPTWSPWTHSRPRVVALHLGPENSFEIPTEYTEVDALESHLHARFDINTIPSRSVYILEGLSDNFTTALKTHFQVPPSIFADHNRLVSLGDRMTREGGGLPFLPAAIHGRDYITLKYHEPLVLSRRPGNFRNLCGISGRHIAATRLIGKFSDIGILRRKCTFWSRSKGSDSWECLIICDPPIKRILTDYSGQTGYDVTTSPYSGGYLDFVPQEDQMRCGSGPPMTSFLEDISFYLRTHSNTLDLSRPDSLRVFMDKIVASHYLKLAEFIQSTIEVVQWNLSRHQDLTSFAVSAAEEQWSDIQAWERRITEYKDDLEGIMLQLQIPLEPPKPSLIQSWKDSALDYHFLHSRFLEIGRRISGLNGSISALASIVSNRHALKSQQLLLQGAERASREAKSVKALTILGIVFIPLTYIASVFSMSQPYGPGGDLFWLYFAFSFPLLGLIALSYIALESGYATGGMEWSLRTLIHNMQGKARTYVTSGLQLLM